MTEKEHLAQVKQMTDAQREEIERRLLIEMAERYGGVQASYRKKHTKRKKKEKSA